MGTEAQTPARIEGEPPPRAEAAPSPAPRLQGHLPALDGVRGLAILMVLFLHFIGNSTPTNAAERAIVWATNYGAYGVDLFFVLSGFLITGILFDSRGKPGYFKNFYVRRALRIFPLYYAVLVVLFVVLPLFPQTRGTALDELREHQAWVWLYGVNIFDGIRGTYALPYIDHFWSLSVEEHFYFVWPFLVWALGRHPRVLMGTSLVMGLTALTGRVVATVAGVSPISIFVLTPFRLDGLALGGFLAILARQPGGTALIVKWTPRVAAVAGALVVGSFGWNQLSPAGRAWLAPTRGSLFLVLLAALLLSALTSPPRGLVARFFTSRPMIFLGVYSYGLYVYHHLFSFYFLRNQTEFALASWLGVPHFVAVAIQATAGAAASVVVAYASYHLFEKHFLSLKRLFAPGR